MKPAKRKVCRWDIEIRYPDMSFTVIEYNGSITTGKHILRRQDADDTRTEIHAAVGARAGWILTLLEDGGYYTLNDDFITNTGINTGYPLKI